MGASEIIFTEGRLLFFDVILENDTREAFFQNLLLFEGNKEVYLGMKDIMAVSQKQLMVMQNEARKVICNFSPQQVYPKQSKLDFSNIDMGLTVIFDTICRPT
jgi:hypothetical protein